MTNPEQSKRRRVSRHDDEAPEIDRDPDAPVDRDSPAREHVRDAWERDPQRPERARPVRPGRQPSEST